MDDLISRQAAISVICNACGKIDCDKMDKCEKLQLPPANSSEFPNNSDTISRQVAIDTIDECFKKVVRAGNMSAYEYDNAYAQGEIDAYVTAIDTVKTLPAVQPERKKGRWLRYGEDGYPNNEDTVFWQCDQCLEQYTGRAKRIPNFCPNCGADMRKENES